MTALPATVAYLSLCAALGSIAGCSVLPPTEVASAPIEKAAASAKDRECLVRAMYFESDRSSDEGLSAVGTVVMNRTSSSAFPHTICGVVGQPGQFARGLMTNAMKDADRARVERVADDVLAGKFNTRIGGAMYFHVAGLRFRFKDMHYVLVAGGNAFYERRGARAALPQMAEAFAPTAQDKPANAGAPLALASMQANAAASFQAP